MDTLAQGSDEARLKPPDRDRTPEGPEEIKAGISERLKDFSPTSADVIAQLRNVQSNPGEQRAPIDGDRAMERLEEQRTDKATKADDPWFSGMGVEWRVENNAEIRKARAGHTIVEAWGHIDTYRGAKGLSPTENEVRKIIMRKAAEFLVAQAQTRGPENQSPATLEEFEDRMAEALHAASIAKHRDRPSKNSYPLLAMELHEFANFSWQTVPTAPPLNPQLISRSNEFYLWKVQMAAALASHEIGRSLLPEDIDERIKKSGLLMEDGVCRRPVAEYGFARQIDVDILQGKMLTEEIHEALDAVVKPILEGETRAKAVEAIREKRKQLEEFGKLALEYQEFLHGEDGLYTLENRSALLSAELKGLKEGWFSSLNKVIDLENQIRGLTNRIRDKQQVEKGFFKTRFDTFSSIISDPQLAAMHFTSVDDYAGKKEEPVTEKPLKREKVAVATPENKQRLAALRASAKNQ